MSVTQPAAPLRVVIAEDAVLLREGLRRLLTEAGLDVAATAGDAARLLHLVAALRPDVVLADIRMPPTQTTEGLRAAVADPPSVAGYSGPRHVAACRDRAPVRAPGR